MNFMIFHILGISSSQLTFIFFRGVETTNQNIILNTDHEKNDDYTIIMMLNMMIITILILFMTH